MENIFRIDIKKFDSEINPEHKLANFYHNNNQGWCDRGLLQK
tara:strand:- start:1515 stop:1640 length:126 start_codon:yes stop_codon:yes gene_type:complete